MIYSIPAELFLHHWFNGRTPDFQSGSAGSIPAWCSNPLLELQLLLGYLGFRVQDRAIFSPWRILFYTQLLFTIVVISSEEKPTVERLKRIFLVIRLAMSAIWGTANPIVVEPDTRDRECVASSARLSPSMIGM